MGRNISRSEDKNEDARSGRIKILFKQAAIGHTPDSLTRIHDPAINLAVWKDAARAVRQSDYVKNLDLDTLAPDKVWENNYFKVVFSFAVKKSYTAPEREEMIAHLDHRLDMAAFPPHTGKDGTDRAFLARSIHGFAEKMAAVFGKKTGGTLLLFRPDGNMFWHTDGNKMRGILTLHGDTGTLWRPDSSLEEQPDRQSIYWGNVQPESQPFIQRLRPGDMAVFKCRGNANPLVHASPVCTQKRLVLTMSPYRPA